MINEDNCYIAFNSTEPEPDELSIRIGQQLMEKANWIDISWADGQAYGVLVQLVRNLLAEESK